MGHAQELSEFGYFCQYSVCILKLHTTSFPKQFMVKRKDFEILTDFQQILVGFLETRNDLYAHILLFVITLRLT